MRKHEESVSLGPLHRLHPLFLHHTVNQSSQHVSFIDEMGNEKELRRAGTLGLDSKVKDDCSNDW